jgi:hypothetical protein
LQPNERLMKNSNCAERKIDILVAKWYQTHQLSTIEDQF